MNSLQPQSIKIKKKHRINAQGEHLYICGGCDRAYKSYPALYLHIKRKHNGVRPKNTKTTKPSIELSKEVTHTGRPQKPIRDVDDISMQDAYLEDSQSEMLDFLGDKLEAISTLDSKPRLEDILQIVYDTKTDAEDIWLEQLKKEAGKFLLQKKEKVVGDNDIDLDFEDFKTKPSSNPLYLLAWLVIWLGKVVVKSNFVSDLCLIFSKVWMVLNKKELAIQDLDNKLVWKEVTKEVTPILQRLNYFRNNKDLLYEFVEKSCHLIGKTFE